LSQHDEQWIRDLIAVYHDQLSYGKEIVELVSLFFEDELHLDDESREFMKDESIPNTLKVFKTKLEELEEFTKENIQAAIKATQKEAGAKGKMLYMPIRIATTGIMHGPDLASSIMLLGKEKVLERLEG
ncbi:glutamate--tRNA ligase, partial [Coprobacillus cateniformis]|nr:glutamate--tRNA ligase [Coprobacillus cateniformis]